MIVQSHRWVQYLRVLQTKYHKVTKVNVVDQEKVGLVTSYFNRQKHSRPASVSWTYHYFQVQLRQILSD